MAAGAGKTITERAGAWLARVLDRVGADNADALPQVANWPGRLASALDERFNLHYLADRLQHERHAIEAHLEQRGQSVPGTAPYTASDSLIRVSVVTPVYGIKLRYVRAFVRSIRRQSYPNWELCVCIDGDPDPRVKRFLTRLAKRDPDRFRVAVHERNKGISLATESALQSGCGAIVVFADSDDVLHRSALAVLAHTFSIDPGIDIAYTNSDILTPWGYRIDPLYKPGWSPELLLYCNYVMHLVAVRRTILDRCQALWDPAYDGAQDWYVMLRTTRLARRIHHIPIVLYHWRALENSTATALDVKPWAKAAARRIQDACISELDPRLECDVDSNAVLPSIRFRSGQTPALHVVEVSGEAIKPTASAQTSGLAYPAHIELHDVSLSGDLLQRAALLDRTMEALPDGETYVLFICTDPGIAPLQGQVAGLVAVAALPEVACVWPFFDKCRGVYTVNHGRLVPRTTRSGYFTPLTGNVLSGPLHGLVLKRDTWKRLQGFSAGVEPQEELSASRSTQTLGALMGLMALDNGLRNVAVQDVTCDWLPPTLDLGARTPALDPYI